MRQRIQECFGDPFNNPTLTSGTPVIGGILLQKHAHVVGEFQNISQRYLWVHLKCSNELVPNLKLD